MTLNLKSGLKICEWSTTDVEEKNRASLLNELNRDAITLSSTETTSSVDRFLKFSEAFPEISDAQFFNQFLQQFVMTDSYKVVDHVQVFSFISSKRQPWHALDFTSEVAPTGSWTAQIDENDPVIMLEFKVGLQTCEWWTAVCKSVWPFVSGDASLNCKNRWTEDVDSLLIDVMASWLNSFSKDVRLLSPTSAEFEFRASGLIGILIEASPAHLSICLAQSRVGGLI